jgi:polyhydroxyalkanoate synthesis regulator phasin
MTDEELAKALRWKAGAYAKQAADRIKALAEQLEAARADAKEAEAYAEELEKEIKRWHRMW